MDQALIPSPFLDVASDQKLDVERPGNEARAFPEVHIQKGEGTIIIITINICQLQNFQHLDLCNLVPGLNSLSIFGCGKRSKTGRGKAWE